MNSKIIFNRLQCVINAKDFLGKDLLQTREDVGDQKATIRLALSKISLEVIMKQMICLVKT